MPIIFWNDRGTERKVNYPFVAFSFRCHDYLLSEGEGTNLAIFREEFHRLS